jgi:hypothetical protein
MVKRSITQDLMEYFFCRAAGIAAPTDNLARPNQRKIGFVKIACFRQIQSGDFQVDFSPLGFLDHGVAIARLEQGPLEAERVIQ